MKAKKERKKERKKKQKWIFDVSFYRFSSKKCGTKTGLGNDHKMAVDPFVKYNDGPKTDGRTCLRYVRKSKDYILPFPSEVFTVLRLVQTFIIRNCKCSGIESFITPCIFQMHKNRTTLLCYTLPIWTSHYL